MGSRWWWQPSPHVVPAKSICVIYQYYVRYFRGWNPFAARARCLSGWLSWKWGGSRARYKSRFHLIEPPLLNYYLYSIFHPLLNSIHTLKTYFLPSIYPRICICYIYMYIYKMECWKAIPFPVHALKIHSRSFRG